MKRAFAIPVLLAALALPAAAQDHYNDITMVDQISTVQTPVVFFFYVDKQLCGSTYVYNGTVTCTYRDGNHHLEARVKLADGTERTVYQEDIDLDHYNYTWTIRP